jgi:hypothetical protein
LVLFFVFNGFFFFGQLVVPIIIANAQFAGHGLGFAFFHLAPLFKELLYQIFVGAFFRHVVHCHNDTPMSFASSGILAEKKVRNNARHVGVQINFAIQRKHAVLAKNCIGARSRMTIAPI